MKKKKSQQKRSAGRSALRKSKSENFLETIRSRNSMVEYFTELRVLNPAATLQSSLNEPRREGGFVRLAHAREEFTAPVLKKGKAVLARNPRGRAKSSGALSARKSTKSSKKSR